MSNITPTPLPALTSDQARLLPVLIRIGEYKDEHQYLPSYRDIADHFPGSATHRPASTSSVGRWLSGLIDFGWIKMERGVCRSISITPAGAKVLAEYKESKNAD